MVILFVVIVLFVAWVCRPAAIPPCPTCHSPETLPATMPLHHDCLTCGLHWDEAHREKYLGLPLTLQRRR